MHQLSLLKNSHVPKIDYMLNFYNMSLEMTLLRALEIKFFISKEELLKKK